jgi:hypothetical protein
VNEQSGMSALQYAVANNHLAAVRCLAAAGADLAARDREGRTPREFAQARGELVLAGVLKKLERAARAREGASEGHQLCCSACRLQGGSTLGDHLAMHQSPTHC